MSRRTVPNLIKIAEFPDPITAMYFCKASGERKAPSPRTDRPAAERSFARQARLLYTQFPLDAVVSLLIAPVLALLVWDEVPSTALWCWLTLLEATVAMRLALIYAFRRGVHLNNEEDAGRWIDRYVWTCLASGLIWGGTVALLSNSTVLIHDLLIVLALGGILMSGLLALTPVLRAYLAQALPLAALPIFWLFWQADPMRIVLGSAGLLYLALAIRLAYGHHRVLMRALRLELENSALSESCLKARDEAEQRGRRQEHMALTLQRQQTLLAHASRLNTLGEMASGLAHEIKQPITAITLYAEAGLARLRDGAPEMDEWREMLEKITAQSARASAIIQRVRHFARCDQLQYAPVCVHDLLDEIADFLNLEAERHAIRIRYDASSTLPPVLADALQIQQVILNLVRNAIDAMSSDESVGHIVLAARLEQTMVEITVQDAGPGLEPGIANQLLRPFFTTKPYGLGLGLPISQAIIEAHGGRLWVTVNSGPGVTFHFTLPVADNADCPENVSAHMSVEAG
ncbi:MAG: HAMP domain-containing histidine kinase [Candidatus Competibacteraceae bacterium]|nr:HAMP domain-containing histidine kinase [Candidatus Competibacteraceae bacterium]